MTRTKFDRQMDHLQDNLVIMASLLDKNREYFVRSVTEKNPSMAEKAAQIDNELQKYKSHVESQCLLLFINQQPVAGDMRRISAALKIITHLKRMSAQITAAVRIISSILNDGILENIPHIVELSETVGRVVNICMTALIHRDLAEAARMNTYDDKIDTLFWTVRHEIADYLSTVRGHEEAALDLLLAAKYMEKTGDHAVSASRWVIFSITGSR